MQIFIINDLIFFQISVFFFDKIYKYIIYKKTENKFTN